MESDEVQGLNLDSGAEKLTWDPKQPDEKPAYDPGPEKRAGGVEVGRTFPRSLSSQ